MRQHGIEAEEKVEKEKQKKKKKKRKQVIKILKRFLSVNDNTVWSFLIKVEIFTYQQQKYSNIV